MSFLIYQFLIKKDLGIQAPRIKNPDNLSGTDRVLILYGQYIYETLVSQGISSVIARYATAIAAHETNGFTSNIFKDNNNAFGYKYVGQKIAMGENRGHAKYLSLRDSVQEFAEYWNRRRSRLPMPVFDLSGFVSYLKNPNIKPGSYFEAEEAEYLRGSQHFYKKLFE